MDDNLESVMVYNVHLSVVTAIVCYEVMTHDQTQTPLHYNIPVTRECHHHRVPTVQPTNFNQARLC